MNFAGKMCGSCRSGDSWFKLIGLCGVAGFLTGVQQVWVDF
jgi:hypothetical protein